MLHARFMYMWYMKCFVCPQDLLFEEIQEGVFQFPDKEWAHISANAKSLISSMLVRDPRDRYSADDILMHPWIMEPTPATFLATPRVLSRNNSSQQLDNCSFAFQRLVLSQLAISESRTSSSSIDSSSSNPFFTPPAISRSNERVGFIVGFFDYEDSDNEDMADDEAIKQNVKAESLYTSLKLSVPSSSLAQRRRSRRSIL